MNHHWRKNEGAWRCRHCETAYQNDVPGRTALLHDTRCSRLSVAQREHLARVRQEAMAILADRRAVIAAETSEAKEHARAQLEHTVNTAHPDSVQAVVRALSPGNAAALGALAAAAAVTP